MLELMLAKLSDNTPSDVVTANVVYAVKRVYTTNISTANVVVAKRNVRPPHIVTANVVLATRRK
ncbi:hypothetical protein ABN214_15680 [Proteus terrae]|uniref:hypothetical protein n=1 Tax=Proteus terrae TaxID=1574161 RepID=UPI0032DBA625